MALFRKNSRRSSRPRFRLAGQGAEPLEKRLLLAFDPSPIEQAMMEHLNRMRMEPENELAIYFENFNPLRVRDDGGLANYAGLVEIQRAIDHFNVNGLTLNQQWASLTPAPPLAWNESLIEAAELHNQAMFDANEQAHQLPGEKDLAGRLQDAGYNLSLALENVFAYSENQFYGHAGFAIDWGEGPGGIQSPAGHRDNIMDARMQEVGIDVMEVDPVNDGDVGPQLITQDFGRRNGYQAQIVGLVWEDGFLDNSGAGLTGIFDPGEGYGSVTIKVQGEGQIYETQTMMAGGYQLVVPPGTYTVSARESFLIPGEIALGNVVVGTDNVKVDFELGSDNNRRPRAVADSGVVDENSSVTLNVASNDTDADGTIVASTVEIWSQPSNGTVVVNANGTVTYTPNPGFAGADSFEYVVADNEDAFAAPGTVSVSINEVNEPPVAVNSSFQVQQDNSAMHNISGDVTDSDGTVNWASLEVVTPATSGSVSFNAQTQNFTYTPNAGFAGADAFSYRVADNSGAFTNVATVSVTVTDVNDNPTAANDLYGAVAGIAKVLDVTSNDTDPDNNITGGSVAVTLTPSNGSASVNGLNITYTASLGFTGIETLRYEVTDTDGLTSNEATVTIYVANPATPWTNPVNAWDVNPDGIIAVLDAVVVINNLGIADITTAPPIVGLEDAPPPFLDVNGNLAIDPLDAVLVINNLGLTFQPSSAAPAAPLSAAAGGDGVAVSDRPAGESAAIDAGPPVANWSSAVRRGPVDAAMFDKTDGYLPTAETADRGTAGIRRLARANVSRRLADVDRAFHRAGETPSHAQRADADDAQAAESLGAAWQAIDHVWSQLDSP